LSARFINELRTNTRLDFAVRVSSRHDFATTFPRFDLHIGLFVRDLSNLTK
jgi:hypothetical protein